jgi:hypothetical protein
MASPYKRAARNVRRLLRDCRQKGAAQQSKVWGYGQRRRAVWVWFEGGQYHVEFNCYGFPAQTRSGSYSDVSSQAIDFLATAG